MVGSCIPNAYAHIPTRIKHTHFKLQARKGLGRVILKRTNSNCAPWSRGRRCIDGRPPDQLASDNTLRLRLRCILPMKLPANQPKWRAVRWDLARICRGHSFTNFSSIAGAGRGDARATDVQDCFYLLHCYHRCAHFILFPHQKLLLRRPPWRRRPKQRLGCVDCCGRPSHSPRPLHLSSLRRCFSAQANIQTRLNSSQSVHNVTTHYTFSPWLKQILYERHSFDQYLS